VRFGAHTDAQLAARARTLAAGRIRLTRRILSTIYTTRRTSDESCGRSVRARAYLARAYLMIVVLRPNVVVTAFYSIACACSVTTRTTLSATCKKPPAIENRPTRPPSPSRSVPVPSNVTIGAWCGSMPTSPSKAGATTLSASPSNRIFSGEITDTLREAISYARARASAFFSMSSAPPHIKKACSGY